VFLEAMAFGLPVICYDRGGQADFLATDKTGYLVKLNDLDAFTRAMQSLHDRADYRRALGKHNLKYVEDFFIDKCAQRYESLFDAAITARKRGAA
jgi:glycosyltransferase involved in cell wall biosynthesis